MAAERVVSAYLLFGPEGVGKLTLAVDFAAALNCAAAEPPCGTCASCLKVYSGTHPDVTVVGLEEDRKTIRINQVREVTRQSAFKPFEGCRRVFVIEGAEQLQPEACEALLKTLEEPQPHVVLVLTCSEPAILPPTILSRCLKVELTALPGARIEEILRQRFPEEAERAVASAALARGRLGWAIAKMEAPDGGTEAELDLVDLLARSLDSSLLERFALAAELAPRGSHGLQPLLEAWMLLLRDLLLVREGVPEAAGSLEAARRLDQRLSSLSTLDLAAYLQRVSQAARQLERNVNPRLALEALALGDR